MKHNDLDRQRGEPLLIVGRAAGQQLPLIGPPTRHTSGTSIRGRTKTSHLANKRIKALMSNGATSTIQSDEELKACFHRKLAAVVPHREKPKVVVINPIRAKLINRVFATIHQGTEYVVLRRYGQAA